MIIVLAKLINEVKTDIAEPLPDIELDDDLDDDDNPARLTYAEYVAQFSKTDLPDAGNWARFEYFDAQGVITKRNVTMWEKRGIYIVGYDRARQEERTFRQDRIGEWICG